MKQILITAMIALIGALAGCGKSVNLIEDKATASVKSLLTQQAYQDEMNWCGQQPRPDLIQGCKNAEAASWLMKDPNRLAQIDKPEPWPNKSTAFFQGDLNVQIEKSSAPANPPTNPYAVENNWCAAQLAYHTGQTPQLLGKAKSAAISPSCVAVTKVIAPGAF